jgi:hypothetical protein
VSKFVMANCRIFSGGCDLTANSNKVDVTGEVEEKDVTNFSSAGWKEVTGGLGSAKFAAEGQWEALDLSKVDDALWAARGGIGAWTVTPDTATVGDLAWLSAALEAKYTLGGTVGDVAPFAVEASGSWPLVRGQIMHPPGTARSTTGSGTAMQFGAITSTQAFYVCLHVLSITASSGTPTLTITIETDDNSGFTTPVTAGTFVAATAISAQTLRIAGAVTDTYWRAKWTIAGGATSPSTLFVVSGGIGSP